MKSLDNDLADSHEPNRFDSHIEATDVKQYDFSLAPQVMASAVSVDTQAHELGSDKKKNGIINEI